MRGQVLAVGFTWALAGCAPEAQPADTANVLELRLGGDYESLATRLKSPPPGKGVRRLHEPPAATVTELPPLDPPEPQSKAVPPQPERGNPLPRRPQPKAEFHVVPLAEGQTLYGLCRAKLGDGGRWKEVAQLNGWTERQASRLRAGQRVKLPVR